jgi:hypothetical protein
VADKLHGPLEKNSNSSGSFLPLWGFGKTKFQEVDAVDRNRDFGEGRFGGRPRKMTDEQVSLAVQLYYNEGMPVREVADAMKLSHMTVWRAIARAHDHEAFNAYLPGWR